MTFHVVTFYQIAYVKDPMKLSREVERISTKEGLSGTFFSTPQGVNATLSGSLEGLNQIVHLLQNSYALCVTPAWSVAKKNPFKKKSNLDLNSRIKFAKKIIKKNKFIKIQFYEKKIRSNKTID